MSLFEAHFGREPNTSLSNISKIPDSIELKKIKMLDKF